MTRASPVAPRGQPPKFCAQRLGVIGPAFFSYAGGIAEALRQRGHHVVLFDERHSNTTRAKLFYRLGLYPSRQGPRAAHLEMIATRIISEGLTDVFLLNTESIDPAFVRRLKDAGVRVHIYMWDGVANKPGFVAYKDHADSCASFDPRDCERFGMTYIPLFAEPVFDAAGQNSASGPRYDVSFCGTVHSSRIAIVAALLRAAATDQARIGLLLYYHSRWLLFAKGLLQTAVWRVQRHVSYRGFSKSEIAAMFAASKFVVDSPHHGQSGLTARTFEALATGASLLTAHRLTADLLPEDLRNRVVVVESIDRGITVAAAARGGLPALSESQRYFLSLDRFIDSLLRCAGLDRSEHDPAQLAEMPSVAHLAVRAP